MDDQIDTGRAMRVGTHYGVHLYLVGGGPRTEEHTDADEPAGTAMAPWIAERMAEAWNLRREVDSQQSRNLHVFTDRGLEEAIDSALRQHLGAAADALINAVKMAKEARDAVKTETFRELYSGTTTGRFSSRTPPTEEVSTYYKGDCPRCWWGNEVFDCGCHVKCPSEVCAIVNGNPEGARLCPYCGSNREHCSPKGLCDYALQKFNPAVPTTDVRICAEGCTVIGEHTECRRLESGIGVALPLGPTVVTVTSHPYVEGCCDFNRYNTAVHTGSAPGQAYCGSTSVPLAQQHPLGHEFVESDNLDPADECVAYFGPGSPYCGAPRSVHRPKASWVGGVAKAALSTRDAPGPTDAGRSIDLTEGPLIARCSRCGNHRPTSLLSMTGPGSYICEDCRDRHMTGPGSGN